jgi:outer membrane autotransporter protein
MLRSLASSFVLPFGSLDWSRARSNGFTEYGGGAISIAARNSHVSSARAAFGVRTPSWFTGPGIRWIPRLEVRYANELLDPMAKSTMAFVDARAFEFVGASSPIGREALSVAAGFAGTLGHFVLSGEYRASFETDRRGQTLTVGVGF